MILKILGWGLILLALFTWLPSVVPGAMSALAFGLALIVLILSLLTLLSRQAFYFKVIAAIVGVEMLIVNDTIRLFGALLNVSLAEKCGYYLPYFFICFIGFVLIKKYKII
ncbi:hypothetical protein [Shewanella surugensis]|uniref:Uncharacterized protein n=1 Tax=Shewanella surugensis TaxID=212020 RepID=A0ABT0LIG0_9GAMM|nr:hypothetical protein [Shewanella surugensis]MCL1126921.1 hypothetical protein [Shewanella surugensis]